MTYKQLSNGEEDSIRDILPSSMKDEDIEKLVNYVDSLMWDSYYSGEATGEEHGHEFAMENCEWVNDMIKDGEFDHEVVQRAEMINYVRLDTVSDIVQDRQDRHREAHPNEAFGWEYCTKCKWDI